MAVYNEADFVMQGREVQDPEIAKDELELYYDVKGKKNGDVHKDKLLDMSGQGKDGELTGFDYDGKLSGYDGDNGLVFDGVEDTLEMPKLSGIDANNFTYQLNNNILAFTGDEVKTVKNGDIEVSGRNYFVVSNMNPRPSTISSRRHYTFEVEPNQLHTLSVYGTTSGTSFRVDGVYVHYSQARDGYQFSSNSDGIVTVDFWQDEDLQFIDGTAKIKLEKGSIATDWLEAPEDLIETTDLKGNILGDMEDIVDASPRDRQSGKEVFTEHADDSHVHVEVDGQSYQHAGSGKNLHRPEKIIDDNRRISGTASGLASSRGDRYWYIDYMDIKPNTQYTFSIKTDVEYEDGVFYHVLDEDYELVLGSGSSSESVGNGYTFATPLNSKYIRYSFPYGLEDSIQFEEGSTATEYEPPAPTPDYPVEIESLNDFDVVSQKSKGGTIDDIEIGGENLILYSDSQPEIIHSTKVTWSYFENSTWKEIM